MTYCHLCIITYRIMYPIANKSERMILFIRFLNPFIISSFLFTLDFS